MAPPKNRRPGFSRRAQYSIFAAYLLAILGAVAGVLLVLLSYIDPTGFSALRGAGAEITAPVSKTITEVKHGAGSGWDGVSAYFNAASKNAAMQKELEASRIKILEARALEQENKRLKRLLNLQEEIEDPIALGRLISSTSSSIRRIATLGVGSRNGVATGQPVRAPEGLIGRILEVSPNTARVLLVSDKKNVTPVKRANDDFAAIATGLADGTVEVKPVNLGINPFEGGDLLITSGSGGLYAPGIPVAVVIRKSEDGAIARILANPASVGHVVVQPIFQPEARADIEIGDAQQADDE